ncbi:MAG: hypothetical protein WB508_09340 [Aeromicrobium sp.]|uniref:hypothetical protein n=1 Tax=Aeromicrobium sp. TaxID=1871063 RepID=UPI003C527CE6
MFTATSTTKVISTAIVALAFALGSSGAAMAAPAQHDTYSESWAGDEHLAAENNSCGPWAATLHETRAGSYRIVEAPGGRSEGEFHVNGVIRGHLSLTPDDPARPTYSGQFREKVNFVITGVSDDGEDQARVGQFRLRAPLAGSDGSTLVLTMTGRLTTNAHGEVVTARFSLLCA